MRWKTQRGREGRGEDEVEDTEREGRGRERMRWKTQRGREGEKRGREGKTGEEGFSLFT